MKLRELFSEEATLWVKLEKHHLIVRASPVEIFKGKPFVITEYIRGQEVRKGI